MGGKSVGREEKKEWNEEMRRVPEREDCFLMWKMKGSEECLEEHRRTKRCLK